MTLSESEVTKLWETFQIFDQDGNGAISLAELEKITQSLGQNLSQTALKEMIREVDTDLSSSIDFEEFQALMISHQGDRGSRLHLAFSVFDEDNSGEITVEELKSVMSQFGLTEDELTPMLQEVDHDGDGSIDFIEFSRLVPQESEIAHGYQDVSKIVPLQPLPSPEVTPAVTPTVAPLLLLPYKNRSLTPEKEHLACKCKSECSDCFKGQLIAVFGKVFQPIMKPIFG